MSITSIGCYLSCQSTCQIQLPTFSPLTAQTCMPRSLAVKLTLLCHLYAGALCQFPVLALSRELYIYQMWDFSNDYGFWNGCGNLVGALGRVGVVSEVGAGTERDGGMMG
jgi:hypothetical protein